MCVWWDTKHTTTNIFWFISFTSESPIRSYLSRSFCFSSISSFSSVSVRQNKLSLEFRVLLQSFWMLGLAAPVLLWEVKREKRWDSLPRISLHCNRTHPSLEWKRHFQCYSTWEGKHGDLPIKGFESHWWEWRSRETYYRNAILLDASRRIRRTTRC